MKRWKTVIAPPRDQPFLVCVGKADSVVVALALIWNVVVDCRC
jgi:hypothetical protein